MNPFILFFPWLCRHPARYLAVQREDTEKPDDKYPQSFVRVTHHLFCQRCRKPVDIHHARPLRTFDEEMAYIRAGGKQ